MIPQESFSYIKLLSIKELFNTLPPKWTINWLIVFWLLTIALLQHCGILTSELWPSASLWVTVHGSRKRKGLYRVWANFGPPKLLSNFWDIVGILLKYRMFNTSWKMTLFKNVHDSDIWRKKSMTFRSLLKIVRKVADFYPFILSANIEWGRKQDSYCNYIRLSQICIAGRNINFVHKVALCFRI